MKKIFFVLFLSFYCSCSAFAGVGTTTGLVLLEPLDARSVGLGGACASLDGYAAYLYYNPASLGTLTNAQFLCYFHNSSVIGINQGSITFAYPLKSIGTFGIDVVYLNAGKMEVNFPDGTSSEVISEQDFTGTISFGKTIFTNWNVGLNAKAVSSRLIESKSAFGFGFDAGVLYKGLLDKRLNAGLSLQNIGTGLKYIEQKDPFPVLMDGGLSYDLRVWSVGILVAADGVYRMKEELFRLKAGIEGNYGPLFLRGGCPLSSADDEKFTVGIGGKMDEEMLSDLMGTGKSAGSRKEKKEGKEDKNKQFLNKYFLDYGITFSKNLGLSHRVSIGMELGRSQDKSGGKKK